MTFRLQWSKLLLDFVNSQNFKYQYPNGLTQNSIRERKSLEVLRQLKVVETAKNLNNTNNITSFNQCLKKMTL